MRMYRAAFELQEVDDSMEQVTQRQGRGTLGWIVRFAGKRKGSYIASVILAILNVVCGFIPFIYLAHITKGLLEKTADFRYCLTQCIHGYRSGRFGHGRRPAG